MPYRSTKTYGHALGLSACFRQWRATSHCNKLHGYALSFKLTFEADTLDARNWVMDFGGLKPIKSFLEDIFDHKTLVAEDDPKLAVFHNMHDDRVCDIVVMPAVGCEAFAAYVFEHVSKWLHNSKHGPRVRLVSVECREHEANSASYEAE